MSGAPDGVRTGVATSWFGDNPNTGTYGRRGLLAGPVTIDPAYNLKATLYGADSSGQFNYPGASQSSPANQVLTWSQTSQTMPEASRYRFMQTYSGYSLLSPGATSNLTNIEGYAWGQRTGVSDSYFVAQDVGTRTTLSTSSSFSSVLDNSSVQVSGRMMGSLTGVLGGQDLTGRMVFQGIESDGVKFTYRGAVTLQADGSMVFNYRGYWSTGTGYGSGSGSGAARRSGMGYGASGYGHGTGQQFIQQYTDYAFGKAQGTMTFAPGTFFSQTATGTVQAILDTNTSSLVLLDKGGVEGTRKGAYPGNFKGSLAAIISASGLGDLPSYGSGRGKLGTADLTMKMQGVVAGQPGAPLAGVMDVNMQVDGNALPKFAGPVSLDPATGMLSGQGSTSINLGEGATANLTAAWIQAPKGSGIKTDSFMVTAAGGKFEQVSSDKNNVATITSTTPMTGHLKGVNAGPVSTDFNLTSTITDPMVRFPKNIQGQAAATMVGVVAGTPGGDKNGIAQAVLSLKDKSTGKVHPQALFGTVNINNSNGQMNAILNGTNPAIKPAVPIVVPATQTGTVTVTPKPGV